ncbi:site-specific integrase [Kitasatospora sp. NPDC058397]|uniref:site-specific integrase n=1 Tax=unclassified Kitasatospora TaxID=2633591 RepID=UPI00365D0CCE
MLRPALSAAWRDELIARNVSTLVPPPRVTSREIKPWTLDQTLTFPSAARTDPLYAPFVLAIALGMRRGEIVGLRWSWVNLENRVLWVRRQLQRVGGKLYEDTTKSSKRRPVPLPRICASALRWHRMRQDEARRAADRVRLHHPHQPTNLYRSFVRVSKAAEVPAIRLHNTRHGCATLLVACGVPPRVVMEILGNMDRLLKRRH